MERLTKYDENAKCYLPFSLADWSEIKIMNKLGELEDVLEKYGIESAEDLDKFIQSKDCQINKWKRYYENCSKLEKSMSKEHQYCLDNWRACEQELAELTRKYELSSLPMGGLVDEARKLEQELAELKQKAIVPKYQIKQHIWLARNNVFQKEPCELIVQNIEYNFKTEDFLYIIDFVEKGHHKSINMCDNGDLFATREEAEQKLTKIRGKEWLT